MAHNNKKIEKPGFHHGSLKEAAENLAYEIVAHEGVKAINLRQIAAECGVDHSALYRHFRNKDGLISSVVLRGFRELNASQGKSTEQDAEAFLKNYVRFAFSLPNIYSLMFSELGRLFYREAEIQNEIQKLIHASALVIGEIPPETRITDETRDKVMRAWAFTHGFIELWQNRLFKSKTPELAEQYILQQVKIYLELNQDALWV